MFQLCIHFCFILVLVCIEPRLSIGQDNDKFGMLSKAFRNGPSSQLVLEDLEYALRWTANNNSALSPKEKQFLVASADKISAAIEKMPDAIASKLLLDTIAIDAAKISGNSIQFEKKALELKLNELHRPRIPNVVENRTEQWALVHEVIRDIETNCASQHAIPAVFFWRVIGNKGLPVLLSQKTISETVGIEQTDLAIMQSKLMQEKGAFSAKMVAHNRIAIQSILDELTDHQRDLLSKRLGVPAELISNLYDHCSSSVMSQILQGKPRIAFCVLPRDYRKVLPRAQEFSRLNPNKSLENEIRTKWNVANIEALQAELGDLEIRHFVEGSNTSARNVGTDLKNLFGSYQNLAMIVDTQHFLVDAKTFQILNGGKATREKWLRELENGRNGWARRQFYLAGAELNRNQKVKCVLIANEATNRCLVAESVAEIVAINNWWYSEIGKILLPQQRRLIFQRNLARNGLVFFLVRGDVSAELNISERQRKRILEKAKSALNIFDENITRLRKTAIDNVLSSLGPDKIKKLNRLLGTSGSEMVSILSSVSNDNGFRALKVHESESMNYADRKGMYSIKFMSGSADSYKKRLEHKKKAYEILGVPFEK